jgi:midasin (ATPase involved in ribosome maturation)
LFTDKVIYYYNELTLNDKIISDHIEINHFLNTYLKSKSHKESFRNYARLHLIPIKIYKSYLHNNNIKKATKPKIYYNTIKISNLYKEWSTKKLLL